MRRLLGVLSVTALLLGLMIVPATADHDPELTGGWFHNGDGDVTANADGSATMEGSDQSIENNDLGIAIETDDIITLDYDGFCTAGAPRVFVQVEGSIYNTWDGNSDGDCGQGADNPDFGTIEYTYTGPNGTIGLAGIVNDTNSERTVTVSNLTIGEQNVAFVGFPEHDGEGPAVDDKERMWICKYTGTPPGTASHVIPNRNAQGIKTLAEPSPHDPDSDGTHDDAHESPGYLTWERAAEHCKIDANDNSDENNNGEEPEGETFDHDYSKVCVTEDTFELDLNVRNVSDDSTYDVELVPHGGGAEGSGEEAEPFFETTLEPGDEEDFTETFPEAAHLELLTWEDGEEEPTLEATITGGNVDYSDCTEEEEEPTEEPSEEPTEEPVTEEEPEEAPVEEVQRPTRIDSGTGGLLPSTGLNAGLLALMLAGLAMAGAGTTVLARRRK